eukprot:1159643-Pelagomonas_calceolata.AAC.1
MDCNVSVIEDLFKLREPMPIPAMYFIQPTPASVTRLLEDFSGSEPPPYASVHIFFSSKVSVFTPERCTHAHTHADTHTLMLTHARAHTYTHAHTHAHAHIYTLTSTLTHTAAPSMRGLPLLPVMRTSKSIIGGSFSPPLLMTSACNRTPIRNEDPRVPPDALARIKACSPLLKCLRTLKEGNLEFLTVDSHTIVTEHPLAAMCSREKEGTRQSAIVFEVCVCELRSVHRARKALCAASKVLWVLPWQRVCLGKECALAKGVLWQRVCFGKECALAKSMPWQRVCLGKECS